jgi:hypothetical protein
MLKKKYIYMEKNSCFYCYLLFRIFRLILLAASLYLLIFCLTLKTENDLTVLDLLKDLSGMFYDAIRKKIEELDFK